MRVRGFLFVLSTACMFGLGAVLGKMIVIQIDPLIIAFMNLAVGCLLLAGCLRFTGVPLFPRLQPAQWRDLLLLSLVGTSFSLLLFVTGLGMTSALKGGFLLQLQGPSAILFAVLLLGERLTRRQLAGMLTLLAGSSLVVVKHVHPSLWERLTLGDALILVGAVSAGFALIPAKRLLQTVEPLQVSFLRLLLGALSLLPVLLLRLGQLRWSLSADVLWAFPLLIVTNFCIAYITWHAGMRLLKAWESAAIMQSIPIFSTIFALTLLHDSLSLLQVLGGVLVIAGGIVISLPGPASAAVTPELVAGRVAAGQAE